MGAMGERASEIGRFVLSRVMPLQGRVLGTGPGAAGARAVLSRLRRLGTSTREGWMLVGDQVFDGWPEELLGQPLRDGEPSRELLAVQSALHFYGIHQQSQKNRMAMDGHRAAPGAYRGGFGQACRRIEPELDRAAGIQRRLSSVEDAVDFEGTLYQIQGLMSMLRGKGIPLDYFTFASDLYFLQFDSGRERVLARWANDYYLYRADKDEIEAQKR